MLKETVTYTDFNDRQQTEDLYFNLTKTEMTDLLELAPRLEKWSESTSGDPRELTVTEIRELLNIIKLLIEKAYGVKTEDGRHFRKSPEAWADFKDSAVYDSFVFGLFQDPVKAVGFMNGILPKGLMEQLEIPTSDILSSVGKAENVTDAEIPAGGVVYTAVEEEIPAWMRENRNPTTEEFRTMTEEQKMAAFRAKNQ